MLNVESGNVKRAAMFLGAILIVPAVLLALWIWPSMPQPTESAPGTAKSALSFAEPEPVPSAPMPVKQAGQSIHGTVWYDKNHTKPAANVFVGARNCHPPGNDTHTWTDAKGAFVIQAYVPDALYALLAAETSTCRVTLECPKVEVKRGQTVENVQLVLEKGGGISGHVLSETTELSLSRLEGVKSLYSFRKLSRADVESIKRRPLAGVEVTLTGMGILDPLTHTTKTDEQGVYVFQGLPFGSYTVTPRCPDDVAVNEREYEQIVTLKSSDSVQVDGIDFRFRLGRSSVSGRLTNPQGEPLAGAEIVLKTVMVEGEGAGETTVLGTATTTSDTAGNYRLDRLRTMGLEDAQGYLSYGHACMQHVIRARMKGYAAAEIAVPALSRELLQVVDAISKKANQFAARENPNLRHGKLPELQDRGIVGVDFVLDKAAAVHGTLVDRNGKPAAKCMLYLQPSEAKSAGDLCNQRSIEADLRKNTDESGRFSFETLPADTYTFHIFGPLLENRVNRIDADNPPLKLDAGNTITDHVVTTKGVE